jgi:hypothetical protein
MRRVVLLEETVDLAAYLFIIFDGGNGKHHLSDSFYLILQCKTCNPEILQLITIAALEKAEGKRILRHHRDRKLFYFANHAQHYQFIAIKCEEFLQTF